MLRIALCSEEESDGARGLVTSEVTALGPLGIRRVQAHPSSESSLPRSETRVRLPTVANPDIAIPSPKEGEGRLTGEVPPEKGILSSHTGKKNSFLPGEGPACFPCLDFNLTRSDFGSHPPRPLFVID